LSNTFLDDMKQRMFFSGHCDKSLQKYLPHFLLFSSIHVIGVIRRLRQRVRDTDIGTAGKSLFRIQAVPRMFDNLNKAISRSQNVFQLLCMPLQAALVSIRASRPTSTARSYSKRFSTVACLPPERPSMAAHQQRVARCSSCLAIILALRSSPKHCRFSMSSRSALAQDSPGTSISAGAVRWTSTRTA
jgi:hypothetical protein